jgi:hypothetical protein
MAGTPATCSANEKIQCRQIGPYDIQAVVDLLVRGFPIRARGYWTRGLDRQAQRILPPDLPRYGYLLESNESIVGVLLVLASVTDIRGKPVIRCNFSSWYVEPGYRSFAPLLMSVAMRLKSVTYYNVSPAKHTWPMIEAYGFTPYCRGQFTAFPMLARPVRGARVTNVGAEEDGELLGHLPEFEILRSHAEYGWLSLVCSTSDGTYPFVFQPFRRWRDRLPGVRLIYCRDIADFVRLAGPIGRYLFVRGIPMVALDANAPIKGLVGVFDGFKGRKYYKGPDPPRLGDLAYTELALFGP